MRGNGCTSFLLHVSQCIIVNQMNFVIEILIDEVWLKLLYTRFDLKVIKYLAKSTDFEEACKRFHYESGKY